MTNAHNAFEQFLKKDVNSNKGIQSSTSESLFKVQPANLWVEEAKKRPTPKQLFSEFWNEGELCILFADANQGKSILAVQIGDSISNGKSIYGFRLQAAKQKVLYFDFELSDKQFETRYSSNFCDHYKFDDWFLRGEVNFDGNSEDIESRISTEIELEIIKTGAKILIIDNLTYLRSDTERAKDALPLMKQLKALKKKHGLSILCLAHTPKRDSSKPITRNDLQGSKMLINFCDAAFAIGESHRVKSERYLKQIKARNTEIIYDSENVILCRIDKEFSFLKFIFNGYGDEQDHLRVLTDNDKEKRIITATEMKEKGMSNVAIAKHFGVSETAVRKWFKKDESATFLEPFERIEPSSNGSSGSS